MSRTLWLVSLLFLLSTTALAQSKFDGKWATDRKPQLLSNDHGVAQLELTASGADGTTVKGTVSLDGRFYTFDQGRVANGKFWFRTLVGPSTYRTWYGELVNEDTLILWSHGLDLVGNNVLDLIQVLPPGASSTQSPPVQSPPAATAPPATTAAPAADRVPSCTDKLQCYVLRRAK
jgi:hypothetical protein